MSIDPEKVRRALDVPYELRSGVEDELLAKAAREWLRLREQPAPDVQAQIEWPDWLSREYQAIVKMVKDAMTRAEDDIRNSEDASGLPRTAAGERNVYAGVIVHAFKRGGWLPPAQMQAQIDAAYERGVADGLRKARS